MVARLVVLAEPHRVDALVLMDTGAGPPATLDPATVDLGVEIARTDGMAVLKAVQDELDPAGLRRVPAGGGDPPWLPSVR